MDTVEAHTRRWLQEVVIGLNLCPFAAAPARARRIRFTVSRAADEGELLAELEREILHLHSCPATTLETTLVIVPSLLQDFLDFNDFLDPVDALLQRRSWRGIYQIASFHPDYCFAGSAPADAGNLTNRSPYPMLHILREASVERALQVFADAGQIPARNIARVESLGPEQRQKLFPYLLDRG